MAEYKQIYVTPEVHQVLKELSNRDNRPPWMIIEDALAYYKRIHPTSRQEVDPSHTAAGVRPRGRPPREVTPTG